MNADLARSIISNWPIGYQSLEDFINGAPPTHDTLVSLLTLIASVAHHPSLVGARPADAVYAVKDVNQLSEVATWMLNDIAAVYANV